MSYKQTAWQDHVVDQNTGQIIQQGTPVSARNLNNMEVGIAELHNQLEIGKRQTVNIMQGVNVISVDTASAMVASIMGNTVINLLGSIGTIKDSNSDGVADGWSNTGGGSCTIVNGYQRITALSDDASTHRGVIYDLPITLKKGGKYLFIVTGESDGAVYVEGGVYDSVDTANLWEIQSVPLSTTKRTLFIKFTVSNNAVTVPRIILYNHQAVGGNGWVQYKDVGLHEVSDTTYAAIGTTITESNIRDYFPPSDGVKHNEGIKVTARGKNILPPYTNDNYNAVGNGTKNVWTDAGLMVRSAAGSVIGYAVQVRTKIGKTYTFSGKTTKVGINGPCIIILTPENKEVYADYGIQQKFLISFTALSDYTRIYFSINGTTETAGSDYTIFSDLQLEHGSIPTSHEDPVYTSILLDTTLAKVDSIADQVYWRDGAWIKRKAIETGVLLDGNLPWVLNGIIAENIPSIRIELPYRIDQCSRIVRYDGMVLPNKTGASVSPIPNSYWAFSDKLLYILLASTETGWLDTILPNQSAVKAFMNGWKATANDGSKYTAWSSIVGNIPATTQTEAYVSANKAPNWTAWATLDYAISQPFEEPEPLSLAGLVLHEGSNQIEIETGIKRVPITYVKSGANYVATIADAKSIIMIERDGVKIGTSMTIPEADYIDGDYIATYFVSGGFSASVVNAIATYDASQKAVLDRTVQGLADTQGQLDVVVRAVAELYKKTKALGDN